MANCTKCGKPVGCGCGLKGGLCAKCRKEADEAAKANPALPPIKPK